jgi:hypothetical protein
MTVTQSRVTFKSDWRAEPRFSGLGEGSPPLEKKEEKFAKARLFES